MWLTVVKQCLHSCFRDIFLLYTTQRACSYLLRCHWRESRISENLRIKTSCFAQWNTDPTGTDYFSSSSQPFPRVCWLESLMSQMNTFKALALPTHFHMWAPFICRLKKSPNSKFKVKNVKFDTGVNPRIYEGTFNSTWTCTPVHDMTFSLTVNISLVWLLWHV